jgi:hypothetical protein
MGRRRVQLVEALPEALIETREEVAVAVEGDPDRGMAEAFLDLFRVGSLRYQECKRKFATSSIAIE